MFLSSHQIGEVERVADIVAILRKGKLLLVERLDELKAQIRELTFTMTNGAVAAAGPCRARSCSGGIGPGSGRSWCGRRAEDSPGALRANPGVQNVEARVPSLEEIFVAYMQQAGARGRAARQRGWKPLRGGADAMNAILFWRIVWKEYRMQRAFWLSMVGITLRSSCSWCGGTTGSDSWTPIGLECCLPRVLGLATFYALGLRGDALRRRTRERRPTISSGPCR